MLLRILWLNYVLSVVTVWSSDNEICTEKNNCLSGTQHMYKEGEGFCVCVDINILPQTYFQFLPLISSSIRIECYFECNRWGAGRIRSVRGEKLWMSCGDYRQIVASIPVWRHQRDARSSTKVWNEISNCEQTFVSRLELHVSGTMCRHRVLPQSEHR